MTAENYEPQTSHGSTQWVDAHLNILRKSIYEEAASRAKADGRDQPEPRDVAQAALSFAPGDRLPASGSAIPRFAALGITGVTLVSCILAVVFGLIGVYQTRAGNDQIASGAFDIAKIFAGAIVGSTGATVSAARRR
jgi:hypothetical protein